MDEKTVLDALEKGRRQERERIRREVEEIMRKISLTSSFSAGRYDGYKGTLRILEGREDAENNKKAGPGIGDSTGPKEK